MQYPLFSVGFKALATADPWAGAGSSVLGTVLSLRDVQVRVKGGGYCGPTAEADDDLHLTGFDALPYKVSVVGVMRHWIAAELLSYDRRQSTTMKSTPYNLIMSALYKGMKGDRPAAGNPTSIVCHGLMDACGVSFPEAHLNAQAMAELALAGHEILGFDTVMPEYSVDQEAAALGCEIDWGDRDRMPDTKFFPHADFSDVTVPVDFLEKPSIRVVLDALSILRRHVGGKVAIIGKVPRIFSFRSEWRKRKRSERCCAN